MPIYEYRCEACGHDLEALQRFSDAQLTTCPACGKETLKKQLSAAGFQLKGSGWYATDFKNSGNKPAAKTTASGDSKPASTTDASETKAASDSKSESSSDSKSESKPATETKSVSADKPSGTAGSSTASS